MMPSPPTVLDHLLSSSPQRLLSMPKGKIGIYALRYPADRIVQIGCVGERSLTEDFYKRIAGRHRTGSEGEDHKASTAFNVGRMYRHLEYRRSAKGRLVLRPVFGPVGDREQSVRSAEAAKKLRNEVIARCVTATWFEIQREGDLGSFKSRLNALEREVQGHYGLHNLPWFGSVVPVIEPQLVVGEVIDFFKSTKKWGTDPRAKAVVGDEEDLLENQVALWKATSLMRNNREPPARS